MRVSLKARRGGVGVGGTVGRSKGLNQKPECCMTTPTGVCAHHVHQALVNENAEVGFSVDLEFVQDARIILFHWNEEGCLLTSRLASPPNQATATPHQL